MDGGCRDRVPGTGTTSEVWPIPIFGSGQGEENCWNLPIKQRIGAGEDGEETHLSPGVSLIYDLAHDSGMLQSELFTCRSQNLVLAKLPNSGFWRYGQFLK